jgi:hypothetical protein
MAYYNQPSMAAGEISPDLYGRVDQELYYIGLRSCLNFIIRQYGGAMNRPGTSFVNEVKTHTKKVRLIPFQFNDVQTYVLELGDQYMRIIKDGAEVLETAKNITAITQANPAVVNSNSHGFSNGDDVYFTGILGMVQLNQRTLRAKNVTTNTFELTDTLGNNINSSAFSAYISGGTAARVYTVATPWLEADLFELNYAQSNDVITIVHPDYYIRDITRTAHAAWTVSTFANAKGPFKDQNITATTVYASATTGSGITITSSTGIFDSSMVGELFFIQQTPNDSTKRWEVGKSISTNDIRRAGSNFYKAINTATSGTYRPDHTEGKEYDGDVGVQWQYLHSGFGIVKFTAYTDSTHMTATVISTLPDLVVGSGNATDIWAKAAWSVAEGYPSALAYHKQRLWLGGTVNQPNAVWTSGVGARTAFGYSNPILDDEAISLKLDSTQQANTIRHFIPLKQLIALTSGAEHLINGANGLILATEPPSADVQGYSGASKVPPIIIGNTALFVQDMGGQVRSLQYSLNDDGFTGIDLSARSRHLLRGKSIIDWGYHKEPYSCIWTVMDNGDLNGFTFMDEQKVFAWHRHETLGDFESVACIREGDETATYFVVKRVINGNTVRYVERMKERNFFTGNTDGLDIVDAYFVDCGLTYDGRNTGSTTITITGGTTWDSPEVLTLTASASTFKSTDVGDQIVFWYSGTDTDGNAITEALRLDISAYTSATIVSAIPAKLLPTAYRSAARTDWEFARKSFLPFYHLEGKAVSCLADGNVVSDLTVSSGLVTLPNPAAVVHIGLPYSGSIETLDMAIPVGQSKAKTTITPRVFVTVQETRAIEVSTDGEEFNTYEPRDPDIGYDLPIPPETDLFEVVTSSSWSNKGRIQIRVTDPLPATILCITPESFLGS